MATAPKEYAPIILFTYKRLDTLRLTVTALQQNHLASESDLFIFSDAAKKEVDTPQIEAVRSYLRTIDGFKSIQIIEAPVNAGLARSVIKGVSQIIEKFGRAIVLEDDLQTTPNFLDFMNTCLDTYRNQRNVFSVSGYSFNLGKAPGELNDAYFLNRGWSWGWATWKDRWQQVDWEVNDYPAFMINKSARKAFAEGGSDLNKMLDSQMAGTLDSWAIRWFYHQFQVKGLTVYPILSKVHNNGFDDNATHTRGSGRRYVPVLDTVGNRRFNLPKQTSLSPFYLGRFQDKMGIKARILSKVETVFQRLF